MHDDQIGIVGDFLQGSRHGILPGISAPHDAHGLFEFLGANLLFEPRDSVAARGHDDIGNQFARGNPPKAQHHNGHAFQLKKLLRGLGTHASAQTSGR